MKKNMFYLLMITAYSSIMYLLILKLSIETPVQQIEYEEHKFTFRTPKDLDSTNLSYEQRSYYDRLCDKKYMK